MATPAPNPVRPGPRLRWRVARTTLLLSVVNAGLYALLDDTLFTRIGELLGRSGRRVAEVTNEVRLSATADQVEKSRAAYDELVAGRETLQAQVAALEVQRAGIATRLTQDGELLRRVSAVLAVSDQMPARAAGVERDAVTALQAVQTDQAELERCEATLRRLTEDLARLDREVDRARRAMFQQADDLDRQRADAVGRRAYQDALDRAGTIRAPGQ